jgi:hypothetical protein
MNSKIEEKILNNHNEAGSFVSLFFLAIDVIIYVVIFNLFGFNTKNISSPKLKLYLFILLDGISRIINAYTDVYNKTFLQETTFSLVATIQFVLSLAMFEQIFTDKNNDSFLENELKIRNKFFFAILFFCLSFSFKGILTSYGILSSIQYICILASISIFYKYINNKIDLFLSNIHKKNSQFAYRDYVLNLTFFVLIYFIIGYILQLLGLVFENKLYESYINMICTIFKEGGKYLFVALLCFIYKIYITYVKDTDFGYTPQSTNPIDKPEQNDKKKVQVYKDEDEGDKL